jgi:hypothetical protein
MPVFLNPTAPPPREEKEGLSEEYQEYLNSPKWAEVRFRIILLAGYTCAWCERDNRTLEVHHLTYLRLGKERDSDLLALCKGCHKRADSLRPIFRSWCRVRYGSNYLFVDMTSAWERFLEERGDD